MDGFLLLALAFCGPVLSVVFCVAPPVAVGGKGASRVLLAPLSAAITVLFLVTQVRRWSAGF